ncbi:MAG: peptide ABC transporter substrate-binding protein [Oscillospiraceae bacterium]
MKKRIISILLIMILITLTFSGCFGSGKAGKSFFMPISDEPTSLDPQIVNSNAEKLVISNCFEGLLRVNENGELVNGVCESYTVSSDGLSLIFKLRQDASWSLFYAHEKLLGENYLETFDKSVTANDFVFGLRRALTPITKSYDAYLFYAIKNAKNAMEGKCLPEDIGVTAVDKYTLKIDLAYADDNFLYSLTLPGAMPCNKNFFDITNGRYGLSTEYLLCNGPFYVSKWNENASIKMSASSVYRGDTKTMPNAVTLYYNEDEKSVAEKIGDNVYDAAFLNPTQYALIENAKKINAQPILNTTYSFIFNQKGELSNPDLRLALCYATDNSKPYMISHETIKASGIVPPFCKIKGENFRDISEAAAPAFNEQKAKSHFLSALQASGKSSIEVKISCTPQYESFAKAVMGTWQRILGVKFIGSVEILENNELSAQIKDKKYDIAFCPMTANSSNVDEFLNSIATANDFLSDDGFAKLTNKIMAEKNNSEKFKKSCSDAEKYLLSNAFILPIFYENSYFVTSKETNGIYYYLSKDNIYFINATKK